jgi:hypothetical protein
MEPPPRLLLHDLFGLSLSEGLYIGHQGFHTSARFAQKFAAAGA